MDINLFYLIITIIIVVDIAASVYIIHRQKKTNSIKNQKLIASLIPDMLKNLESTLSKKEYTAELQNKTKELEIKKNALEQIKQNLEKEKKITEQKIQDNTRDLQEEYTKLYYAINNLDFGFIITDKEKNIKFTNKATENTFSDAQIKTYIQENLNSEKTLSLKNIQINNKLLNIFLSHQTPNTTILLEDKTEERSLEQSNKNFITVASHELRTPLTGIKGYLSLIKQFHYANIKDEKLKKMIDDVDNSCTRLISIVNDFLDTSKLEQGKIDFHPEETDLLPIVNDSIKETGSIATEKKLSIQFNTPLKEAKVFADPERIKQVTINLISNAIKYTDKGQVTITVEKTPDNYYKVTVKDTGRGITPENVESLFSKFQQNDPNKPVNVVSSGLGLYISKVLIEKMNGKIQLDSTEKGKGSTFSFSLPVYEKKTP